MLKLVQAEQSKPEFECSNCRRLVKAKLIETEPIPLYKCEPCSFCYPKQG